MRVKDLIKLLAEFDKDEEVFIGLGENTTPNGASKLIKVSDFTTKQPHGDSPFGAYLIPLDTLVNKDGNDDCLPEGH